MNDPRTQFSDSSDHNLDTPFGHNLSRFAPTNGICRNGNDQESLQFRPNLHQQESMDCDDSGVCSPPLWKNSPSPSQPLLNHHRSLSPNSRIQAITRGQRELMELVKNLPESSYELSMKDLVEVESTQTPPSNSPNLQRRAAAAAAPKVGRQGSKKNERGMMRIESFEDRGLFLKMVFPFSLKSKKKKNFGSNSNGKVSPKPEAAKGGGGGGGGVERDWWKKKFSGSSDSDSSRTSNNSGSTGSSGSGGSSSGRSDGGGGAGRRKNDLLRGCWPFLQSRIRRYVE